ncbi:dienelactone hydrolase [Apiospora phragmitis]|uniref:Dienelactone hydrolase n=1 Tax=Apiospora phragmitis TaxID=2905665 RepID=A0ABR1T2Y4_9PEZI
MLPLVHSTLAVHNFIPRDTLLPTSRNPPAPAPPPSAASSFCTTLSATRRRRCRARTGWRSCWATTPWCSCRTCSRARTRSTAGSPADTPEKQALVKGWFDAVGDYRKSKPKLLGVRRAAGERFASVRSWGVFGLCWGGKAAVLASGEDNEGEGRRINVSGTAHPGALDAADAEALSVPYIVLASEDEPADVVAQYKEIIEGRPDKTGVVETYSTMGHGWMGVRAKLDVEDDRKEYERGYKQVADFFGKYL